MKIDVLVLVPALLVLPLVGAGIFAWSGAFNPAADDPHWGITYRVLDYTRTRGIVTRTGDIVAPDLEDPALIRAGAGNYAAMCVDCHLAPGMPEGEIQRGMYPAPPNLSSIDGLDPIETFWVIKHGVKMSGMPAWGKSMDNADIWGMTAFVRRLPGMSAETYAELVAASGGHEHGGSTPQSAGHAGRAPSEETLHTSTEAEMDHGKMAGMKSGSMAGMDRRGMAGMDHGPNKTTEIPPPREISGPAEAALQAFGDSLQVGNVRLALERLHPELVVIHGARIDSSRLAYAAGNLKTDMALLKNAKIQLLSREVESGPEMTVIVSESRITTSGAAVPTEVITTERATLRATADGWQIERIEWNSRPAPDDAARPTTPSRRNTATP